jgi:uncharacterized protein
MAGRIAGLYRHPIKGFTPEALNATHLDVGGHFPCDRIYAVEDGPSGFDPGMLAHISKMRFIVLAKIPALARAHTQYDDISGQLSVMTGGGLLFAGTLTTPEGRSKFERWLADFLSEEAPEQVTGPLKVLVAPGRHRFADSRKGFVSVLNLESVRDLERRLGKEVDPARFRANVLVQGWPAWSEYGREAGTPLRLGGAQLKLLADIDRCAATHVDPKAGIKDIDMVPELFAHNGHICCGIYAEVSDSGSVAIGDQALLG